MTTDVIIVNWNSLDDTLKCLQSVMPQARQRTGVRVIVVDNGSTDGSALRIAALHPDVTQIVLLSNRGFTGGVAAGLQAADAELAILLNNDATAEPEWLDRLVDTISAAPPDVVAVSGKIISSDGTTVDFIEGALTFDGHAFQRDFRRPLGSVSEPARLEELLFACGGNMIVRRKLFIDLGGFDDDYFAYLEDVDFGWRAWIAGYRIVFEPLAVVRHRSSATSDRLGPFERGVLFERNALQTTVKNFSDARFGQAMAPVLLTLLHRLHHYVISRNGDTSRLTAAPFAQKDSSIVERFRGRTRIDDALTEMQFRAIDWFFQNSEGIMEKRAAVQARRRRSDEEIFSRFPLHVVPTYPGDEALFAGALFRALRLDVPFNERTLDDMMLR